MLKHAGCTLDLSICTVITTECYTNVGAAIGDFVDRGAWGTELLAVLAAWKLALPRSVLLLRGNHESTTCTKMYGFHAELQAKFGVKPSQASFHPILYARLHYDNQVISHASGTLMPCPLCLTSR